MYLESFGMMRENAEFDIQLRYQYHWYSTIKLWWPSEWSWSSILDMRQEHNYWYGEDRLADGIREQLQSPAFSAYLNNGTVREENGEDVTYTYTGDADFPEIVCRLPTGKPLPLQRLCRGCFAGFQAEVIFGQASKLLKNSGAVRLF